MIREVNVMQFDNVFYIKMVLLSAMFGVWFGALLYYYFRTRRQGRFQCEKVQEKGGTKLLGAFLMEFGYWAIHFLGRALVKSRISPNLLTLITIPLAISAAAAAYLGRFGLGGWLLLLAGIFDVLDGMVARESGKTSREGKFLDTIVDRYCELFFFLGAMGYYFSFKPAIGLLVGAAMIASLMITFTRTKAEAMGISDLPSGFMRRHERLLFIGVGMAASPFLSVIIEPRAENPVFHMAILAFALVATVGMATAVRLGWRVFILLKDPDDNSNEESLTGLHAEPKN